MLLAALFNKYCNVKPVKQESNQHCHKRVTCCLLVRTNKLRL